MKNVIFCEFYFVRGYNFVNIFVKKIEDFWKILKVSCGKFVILKWIFLWISFSRQKQVCDFTFSVGWLLFLKLFKLNSSFKYTQ